jgi:hypothetical protein
MKDLKNLDILVNTVDELTPQYMIWLMPLSDVLRVLMGSMNPCN